LNVIVQCPFNVETGYQHYAHISCLLLIRCIVIILLLYLGHGDCVRGVAVLNAHQFLSCSNDTTIRHWSTADGACLKIYYGHISFVYAVVALPNGTDFISCGEDHMLRVWHGGTLSQSIAHPAQSVWSTCVLSNGDIVTGAR